MGRSTSWAPGEVLSSSDMNLMPRGKLGYAEVTADQTGITSEADLTSLTVTCTPGTSRRIRISAQVIAKSDTSADEIVVRIKEGSTTLDLAVVTVSAEAVGRLLTMTCAAMLASPSATSHTYKLTMERTVGAGTLALKADPAFPAFICVEDIGA